MEHDVDGLGSYVLGGLNEDDRRVLEQHLAGCQQCEGERMALQAARTALGEVPPEFFLDGPPEGADLLLQRTLRQVRDESAQRRRRRHGITAAAAAATAAVALTGGLLLGRALTPPVSVAPPPSTASSLPAGTSYASATDPTTGARMTVQLVPAPDWVRVTAAVTGIPEGQNCRLWVRSSDGTRQQAGGWVVSSSGASEGTTLQGTAAVPPAAVMAVEVDNTEGRLLVSVPI